VEVVGSIIGEAEMSLTLRLKTNPTREPDKTATAAKNRISPRDFIFTEKRLRATG